MVKDLVVGMADRPDLSHAYSAAKKMIQDGDLPNYAQRKRLKDLGKFCKAVTLGVDDTAFTDILKLPFVAQSRISQASGKGGFALEDGCHVLAPHGLEGDAAFECKGKQTCKWMVGGKAWDGQENRLALYCAHCSTPAIYGRLFTDALDCLQYFWYGKSNVSHSTIAPEELEGKRPRRG